MHARTSLAALGGACLVGVWLIATASAASAALGEQCIVNGDIDNGGPNR